MGGDDLSDVLDRFVEAGRVPYQRARLRMVAPIRERYRSWDFRRLLRDAYVAFALAIAVVTLAGIGLSGVDGRAYWLSNLEALYTGGSGSHDAFLYSPAFAQFVAPFTVLPWPIFLAGLTTASLAALWYLLGP